MNLKVLAGPAVEPCTLAEVKSYCRVDSTDDDSTIAGIMGAAREYVERHTKKTLIYTAYRLTLDAFPAWDDIELPRIPAISAASATISGVNYDTPRIRYWDGDGNQQTMVLDVDYELLLDDNPPRIVLPSTMLWPVTLVYQRGSVEVDFVAGYGSAPGAVPPLLRMAVKILTAHWYEHRDAVGSYGTEVPLALANILSLHDSGGYN